MLKTVTRFFDIQQIFLIFVGLAFPLALFLSHINFQSSFGDSILQDPTVLKALRNSLILMVITGVMSPVIAFFFSWILWRFAWPKTLFRSVSVLLKLPYLVPPFFLAMGWVILAAPEVGYLQQFFAKILNVHFPSIYGLEGTVFVLILWSTSLAMIQLQSFFLQFQGSLEDAALLCGASPAQVFYKITLPIARPYLISCALLTSLSSLAAFGVPALLSTPVRDYVLTTKIYQSIKGSGDFSSAGSLSILLLSITCIVFVIQKVITKQASSLIGGKSSAPALLRVGFFAKCSMFLAVIFAWLSSVLPLGAVFYQSFLRDRADLLSFTLDKYLYVLRDLPDGVLALGNSLLISLTAALLATVFGVFTAYGAVRLNYKTSKSITQSWNLSYAIPGTIIALALLIAFTHSIGNTIWILVLAYFLKYAAFSTRTLSPSLQAISKDLEEAAWMSGASSMRAFFKVMIPLLMPALSASFVLLFIPMLSELTMSVLLVGAGTETLGTLIYRFLDYADPGAASVLAVILMGLILVLNFLLRKISRGSFGI